MTLVLNGTTGVSSVDGSASTPVIQGTDSNTGIFFPAADTVAIATGGSERMRVDSSGNVGIGVTPTVSAGVTELALGSASTNPRINGVRDGAAAMLLTSDSVGTSFYERRNLPLLLGTNNNERARIDSSGRFGLGVSPSYPIQATLANANDWFAFFTNSSGTAPYGLVMKYSGASPNGTASSFYLGSDSTATRFEVRSNGGIANYSANNVNLSDRREKINFAPAGEYLSKICAIPVQTFNYIDQNMEEDPGETLGVVAQDVQAVAPELVMESNWGTQDEPKMRLSIYQTDLQYALMKCIQEQQALIESLTARIAALEAA